MLVPRDNHLDQAWQIVFDLLHGGLSLADIEKELRAAAGRALQARAEALLRQLGHRNDDDNERALRAMFDALAAPSGEPIPFERYRRVVESEIAGIVITAHPTFALSPAAAEAALRSIAAGVGSAGDSNGGVSATDRPAPASAAIHRDTAPTLQDEIDASTRAMRNVRRALRKVLRIAVDVAATRYPDRYRELRVRLLTPATWVGFDLDGRTDIGWNRSVSCRYALALGGLDELRASLDGIRSRCASADVDAPLELIRASLDALAECFVLGAETLGQEAADSRRLGRLNRLALEKRALKQDAIGAVDSALATLSHAALPAEICKDIVVLESEWESVGIGLARVHFRVNSVQLHNAIRPDISMLRAPGRSASRRHYLAEISRLLDTVTTVNVHYGSVAREPTTAKRVFMLVAQFRKHFDDRTPIRLLIAESDTPFTLLVALYYARLFGVEGHVEISPLFETADGLHHGDRVISEVLDNPHFLDYLRRQGRFCVQLGFSDSGRYIGQPAASLAIERFKLRLVRLWAERGLQDVQLAFFDTFGESIGRGAHPGRLADRFLYTHSREVRHRLDALGTPHKHEVSFQGGEGYLWFASESTALAVIADLLAARLEPTRERDDRLYTQSGWALDFFLTLQDFQARLTRHPGYLELIDALGRSLLYPAGSRPQKRQSGTGQGAGIESLADLRAIPNNAILHQLGYLANSCAGIGQAADQSPDTFLAVLEESERLERILSLALTARERSDMTMLEAYVQLTSAGYWLDRSSQSLDRDWNRRLRRISRVLEETFDQSHMANFVRTLRQDAALLDDVLDERHVSGAWSSADALTKVHVMRLALIQFIYIKAMGIPRFSPRLEISLAALVERLARLDVPATVAVLREIFPVSLGTDDAEIYAEQDTYVRTSPAGYAAEHEQILDPIQKAYELILEISALIALHVGAYG
jgi:phosphoenolpyruvate carboxylase